MHDRSLEYVDLFLEYKDLSSITEYELPEGFSYKYFRPENIYDWVKIEIESGEIENVKKGLEAFAKFFGEKFNHLPEAMIFIEHEQTGELVGTATGTYMSDNPNLGNLDWVAIISEFRGQGLAKPLITKAMSIMRDFGYKKATLHTQTHTFLAVQIYKKLGWVPYKPESQTQEDFDKGWQIITARISNLSTK